MSSPQSSDNSPFVSAPTSPFGTFNIDDVNFYSLPPSPSRATWRSSYSYDLHLGTEPATPGTFQDAESSMDDFEFDTSRRFFFTEDYGFETSRRTDDPAMGHNQRRKASLPAMTFADELFCDGKVVPLKPPPRLLYDQKPGSPGSTPASPNSSLKIPFPRRNLWNDDFDPFMAALDKVRTGRKGKSYQADNHRRARSMSPLRASSNRQPNVDFPGYNQVQDQFKQLAPILTGPNKHVEPIGPYSIWIPNMSKGGPILRPCEDVQKSPMKLAEPKGVIFGRQARMVKMDYEWPKKPNMTMGGLAEEATKQKKRQEKIKNFIKRGYSMIKTSDEHKQTDEHLEPPKPKSFRKKISFKSLGLTQPNYDEKGVAQVTKMTLAHYKPKLLLCMGFGAKYAN